uniref:Methyltransferase type 11 domain-containing protein n=2 Tax=Ascaris TaxID=6251 RepID=A0A9J2PQ36_ASCLU
MPILPRSADSFADPQFWQKFYSQFSAPFEWYGDFSTLGSSLERYLKITDRILQIGCGNSKLATELYDSGYRNIWNIDTDEGVIKKQIEDNCPGRKGLEFLCASAQQLPFDDESMSVVLDKGLLDAILPPERADSSHVDAHVAAVQMFREVNRVLTFGGRYIVVSLAQPHVLLNFVAYFCLQNNFIIRVQQVEQPSHSYMPVFLLIATKLRIPLKTNVFEFAKTLEEKPERFERNAELRNAVSAAQEFAWFAHTCKTRLDHQMSLTMTNDSGEPRYRIWIVDDPNGKRFSSFAAFIVPLGREGEWMYDTENGRSLLLKQSKKSRLAVVLPFRDQAYESMEAVKKELDKIIIKFAPANLENETIEYLSLGEVNVLKILATGKSEISDKWSVEDVEIGGVHYRRLIFLSSSNVTQSEARVIRSKRGKWIVDLETLTCRHHEAMLTAFSFLPQQDLLHNPRSAQLRLAVLGLGGGLLSSFLYRCFTEAKIVAVELDPEVVEIAKRWFALPSNDARFSVVVKDALRFLEETEKKVKSNKLPPYDVLFVDLAAADPIPGLSCPPHEFLTTSALTTMNNVLSASGVLALNLVTRDAEVSHAAKATVMATFPRVYLHTSAEDINQVLICPKSDVTSEEAVKKADYVKEEGDWLNQLAIDLSSLTIVK